MNSEENRFLNTSMGLAKMQQIQNKDLPQKIKVVVETSDIIPLQSIIKKIPLQEGNALFTSSTKILDLLAIEVQPLALATVVSYWEPALGCFTFKGMDLTPTLEEYCLFLGMPIDAKTQVYSPSKNKVSLGLIANLFGVDESDLKKKMENKHGILVWPSNYVFDICENLVKRFEWKKLIDLVIALIYGLILFPHCKDSISHMALDVYFRVVKEGENPVPAIMADTLLSLNYSRRSKQSKLKCCHQLLYVWLMCHIKGQHFKCLARYINAENVLQRFPKEDIPKITRREEWFRIFDGVSTKTVKWQIPAVAGNGIITACDDSATVPLIGTWGCVTYSPLMVLKQFGRRQFIPPKEVCTRFEMRYENGWESNQLNGIRQDWHHLVRHDQEFCPADKQIEKDYQEWLTNRKEGVFVPIASCSYYPPPHESVIRNFEKEKELNDMIAELEDKLLKVEIENHKLREENARLKEHQSHAPTERIVSQLK